MSKGRFIVLEGIDGAGKTEQSRRLAVWLRERGEKVVETREPSDGAWGRRYRSWARGDFEATPLEVLRFFVEDRREHVARVVEPALERGDCVICDRYIASTLAYQAAAGLDRQELQNAFPSDEFPQPDLVLWLQLPIETALARMGATATERFEKADFLKKVEAEYARLPGLTPIDASGDMDEVQQNLRKAF
ncbi:MAG: dTMP kinase [bacterium]|nr:dTMP kinase [bacterium]